ncbi:MAG TPA: TonB-dependent receptor [Opitutaceae bacterium]|nr:TonB-dependent receptor [Opitutaceae bacterium]
MSRFLLLSVFLGAAAAVSTSAQTTPPPDPSSAPIVLDRLVVTSEKLNAAREDIVPSLGAVQFQIDRPQLEALAGGLNASFNNVLLRAPGVAQDSYGQVHVRGEHADLQYRINDVLLPEGLTGFGQELDTRFADSVNILTGALPAQYGYRTAGIVDIHTRTDIANGGNIGVYGGSFGTLRSSVEGTGSAGRWTGYATASAEQNDLGVENPTSNRNALHDHKTEEKAFAYGSYLIDDTSRINLMLSASFARFQIPNNPGQTPAYTLAGMPSFDSANLDENQREENHYAIIAYQKSAGDYSGQVSAFTRYSLVAFTPDRAGDLIFNGVASRVHRSLVGNGLESDNKWTLSATHTLRAGLLVTSTNAGTRTTTAVFATDADGQQISSDPFDVADDQRKLGWFGGVYAQDEWKATPRMTVNYGVRADTAHGYVTEGQLSPRINLVYQLGPDTTVHLGYARYFTPPPVELVQTATIARFAGTTNQPEVARSSPVRAERAHYFDAGIATKLGRNFAVSLDAYQKRSTNLLDEGQFGTALIFSPFNYRTGGVVGTEVALNYTQGGFSAYANAAVSRAEAREIVSGEFQFGQDELDYIATHDVHLDHDQLYTASAGVSYRSNGTLVSADVLYGSGLRSGFANTGHLPEYHPVNIGLQHDFGLGSNRQLRARLDVVNLFDEIYELRDGSGIGVGAPQYGSRRGVFGTLTFAY